MDGLAELLKYIFLGLLQGFTEPIPISSSGHVVLAQHLFGMDIEGFGFEVLVNFASLLAVLAVYREDLLRIAGGFFRYAGGVRDEDAVRDYRFVWLLVLATVPAVIAGFTLEDWIEQVFKGNQTRIIGATLLVTAVALWLIRNYRGQRGDGQMTVKDAVIIGCAQAVALIPGISRSGATIVGALSLGINQATALRFSFFMYIPVSVGSMVLAGGEMMAEGNLGELWIQYTLAFLASLVASYYSLRWFMGIMARGNLKFFAYYCVAAGLVVLLFF